MQRRRIQTAGQRSSAGRDYQVISSCQTGDAVKQDDDVLLVLYQSLCPFNNHFGYSLMMLWQFVKGGIYNLNIRPFYGFPEIGHFFRPFVNQKDNQMHVRIIYFNGLRHLL